jgi:hypothetical protein
MHAEGIGHVFRVYFYPAKLTYTVKGTYHDYKSLETHRKRKSAQKAPQKMAYHPGNTRESPSPPGQKPRHKKIREVGKIIPHDAAFP